MQATGQGKVALVTTVKEWGTVQERRPARSWISELAGYREPDRARSIREVAVTLGPVAVLWWLAWQSLDGPRIVTLALAILIGFFLMRVFCLQHDCGHYSLFRSRRACDWLGRALSLLTITPYRTWQTMHAEHHAHVGDLDASGLGEVRTLTVAEYRARGPAGRLAYRAYRHPLFLIGVAPFLLFFVQYRLPFGLWRRGWRFWISTMGTNLALAVLIGAMVRAGGWAPVLWIFVPSVLFGATAGVITFYLHHQFEGAHFDRPPGWDRHHAALNGSSQIALPGWLQWFTANISLHHVHHLLERIPFYRLPEVLRDHPELAATNRIGWRAALSFFSLGLWDEEGGRLVRFADVRL